jgi:hypothetical protein
MPLGATKRLACYSDVWTTFQRERLWFKERERGLHRKGQWLNHAKEISGTFAAKKAASLRSRTMWDGRLARIEGDEPRRRHRKAKGTGEMPKSRIARAEHKRWLPRRIGRSLRDELNGHRNSKDRQLVSATGTTSAQVK